MPGASFKNLKKTLIDVEVRKNQGFSISRSLAYNLILECTKLKDLECSKRLWSLMSFSKLDSIPVLADHLIRLFASCGSLDEAKQVFENVSKPSVHTWCAIISAHAKLGQSETALQLYDRMLASGIGINKFVCLAVLKACSNLSTLTQGRQIHDHIIKNSFQSDVILGNAVIDMYAKCGRLDEASKVFNDLPSRTVVSWNAMLAGCIQQGDFHRVVQFFDQMQGEGIQPNVVSWSAVIEGYAQHGEDILALESYSKMLDNGLKPDRVTYLSILKACGNSGAIFQGRVIHDQIIRLNSEMACVGNALIDMYGKCGSLLESQNTLDRLRTRDVVTWNTMIAAYSQTGNFILAIQSLDRMQKEDIKPDDVTYVSILAACSHAGLEAEFFRHITGMNTHHGLEPNNKHYACMIDLLGNTGKLCEAGSVHQIIPPDLISLTSLLTACSRHGNIELGKLCFEKIIDIEPQNSAAYALMLGMYNDAGMWKEAEMLEAKLNMH